MFKVNNKDKNKWCRFGVFIVNFEHIPHLVRSSAFTVSFELVIADWADTLNRVVNYSIKDTFRIQ